MKSLQFCIATLVILFGVRPFLLAGTPVTHAFLWTKAGGMQDLGVPAGWTNSFAIGISDLGEVVGCVSKPGNIDQTAATWTAAAGWRVVDTGLRFSCLASVNNSGEAAGTTEIHPVERRAFVWTGFGSPKNLGTLGGLFSVAHGINRIGDVVGSSLTAQGDEHAFRWSPAQGMQDLGVLPDSHYSAANAINDRGLVVGAAVSKFNLFIPVIWEHDQILFLSSPKHPIASGAANGVNHLNQVVGTYTSIPGIAADRAFLWSRSGGLLDLGRPSGVIGSFAWGINDAGEVVGINQMSDQTHQGFYWTAAGGMESIGTLGGTGSAAYAINASGQVVGYSYLP